MNLLQRLEKKRQTKLGLGLSIAVEAALAYIIGSLAIDSGSLFDYVMTALLVILLIQDMVAYILLGVKPKNQKPSGDKKGKDRG
jgi:hypothetical protein